MDIKRGTVEIISEAELNEKLKIGKPLRVKWGADPSAPDLHLGHTVILTKLRQLQDLGHEVLFIIGDFTAMIGDPTGKSQTRKPLTRDEVKNNAKTYSDQVFKILDKKKTKIVYNSHWLSKLNLEDTIKLAGKYTVARMLEREDFKKRFKEERAISIHEFLYPLLQGYDSIYLKADVEIGGTDQKFNMLVGRELQREEGQKPQVVVTMPILEGLDGVNKMSKSLGNYIGITEAPTEIFGKVMSISDQLMLRYYELLTDLDLQEIKKQHPKEAKKRLARYLIARFYDEKKALQAENEFESIFSKGMLPQDIESKKMGKNKMNIIDLLAQSNLAPSRSEAKRLVGQAGVRVDDVVIKDEKYIVDLSAEKVVNVGKRKFLRVQE